MDKLILESEKQMRLVADAIPALISYIDAEHHYQFVNKTYTDWFGQAPEEITGRHVREILGEAAYEAILPAMERVFSGEAFSFEQLLPYKDGGSRFVLTNYVPDKDESGKVKGYFALVQDITERKKSEEIGARYQMLSVRARDVILFVRRDDGQIVDANQKAVETYGYDLPTLLQMKIHDLRSPETLPLLAAQIKQANEGGIQFETVHRRRDGTTFPVEVSTIGSNIGGERLLTSIIHDITERKEAEKKLRRTQARLESALEAGLAGTFYWDIKKDRVITDENMLRYFSLSEKAIAEGVPIEEVLPAIYEEDRQLVAQAINDAIEKTDVYSIEYRVNHSTGKICWLSARGIVERDESGAATGMSGFAVDITRIKEAEERLRLATEAAEMFSWEVDHRANKLKWSENACKVIGCSEEELSDKIADGMFFVLPEDRERVNREFERLLKEGEENFLFEFRGNEPENERKFWAAQGLIIYDANKSPVRVVGVTQNVTERKQAQEALIKAERRAAADYQALLSRIVPLAQTLGTTRDLISIYRCVREFVRNSMPCSAFFISFYDAQNNLRTAAYAWGDKGEVDISDLPPMTLTKDGGPNSQAVFQKKSVIVNHYMKFMENRPHVILQKDGIDPQTSLVVPMVVMNRVVGTFEVQAYENNAFEREHIVALEMVANLAAVAVENVRLLQIEAKAREAAEAANSAKDEFLSVLSHELRTPLNSMLGWVRMLRTGMLDEERSNQAIEVIERNTRLQNSLIEDLLDVSRIISGKMRIDKEEVDLVAVAENSCEVLRPSAEGKNIIFELSSEEESILIEGDAVRMHQVISNLVQNAIKFTPEGGKISVGLKNTGDKAHLVVKDTGIGIEREFLPFIFERFRQADASTRRNYNGLGLGLTIVSNLVELHGGKVRATSDGKGQGSTFIVELPLSPKYLDQTNKADGKNLPEENDFNLKGARVLLVDDDAESIIPLQMLLEREKAEVVTVFSADEALAKLMEQTFHILISDIGMPLMDGYDLIAKIRKLTTEHNAFLPAIALTAYAANEDRRRALSAGFQMHFSKPFDFDELLEAVIKLYKDGK